MSNEVHAPVNAKTIKLSKGKHSSPEEGACVMELASMLACEPFSDQPKSVCPVIGTLLRTYNDSLDDERRQDLYRYASQVIGTRASFTVERARMERCLEWAREMKKSQTWLRRVFRPLELGPYSFGQAQSAAQMAIRSIPRHTDDTHAAALALVDELCAIGVLEQPLAGLQVAHAEERPPLVRRA
jgi:hypothetical protein